MAGDPSDAGRFETPGRGPEEPADTDNVSKSDQVPPDGPVRCVDRTLLEALVCPVRKTTLFYDAERQELISPAADLAFPIEDGVPILVPQFARGLTDEDRRRYRIK